MNPYQAKWESRSSIRTHPRKEIDFTLEGFYFPPKKQLLLDLPEIKVLDKKIHAEILLQTLYKYLNDIVNIEIKLINKACNLILVEDLVIKYSDEVKLNAYTIIIDEYYHVYIAQDMINQLKAKFSFLQKLTFPHADAYSAVDKIKRRLDTKYINIFEIIVVCIFETTLVRELVEFFNDNQVHPSIKHYVNDHINDESKHYHFFYDLLIYTWGSLPDDYKKEIGQHLGDFVVAYLSIDSEKEFNLIILTSILEDKSKAEALVNRIYNNYRINVDMPIVKNVLRVLKNSQIMDNDYVKTGFIRNGLYI